MTTDEALDLLRKQGYGVGAPKAFLTERERGFLADPHGYFHAGTPHDIRFPVKKDDIAANATEAELADLALGRVTLGEIVARSEAEKKQA